MLACGRVVLYKFTKLVHILHLNFAEYKRVVDETATREELSVCLKDAESRPHLRLVKPFDKLNLADGISIVIIFHSNLNVPRTFIMKISPFLQVGSPLRRPFQIPSISNCEIFEDVVHDDDVTCLR